MRAEVLRRGPLDGGAGLDLGAHLLDHFFEIEPPGLSDGVLRQKVLGVPDGLIERAGLPEEGHTADEVLREMDSVVADLVAKGVTDIALADAKVRFKSNFYNQLESTFGKTHLLSVLALFRDDPNQINSLLAPFEKVTAEQVRDAAKKYLVASNRTVIDRTPEKPVQ